MEDKGYLLGSGRIVSRRTAGDAPAIARLHYRETRYNLRRVFVSRTWIARMIGGYGDVEFTGETRKEVVEQAMTHYRERNAR